MKATQDVARSPQRQTYFLVAGEIVMEISENAVPTAVRLNTVVKSTDGRFATQQIIGAQQALQFQLHKRVDGQDIKIVDVVILGIMPLGQFTDAEFNARPKGMDIREVVTH